MFPPYSSTPRSCENTGKELCSDDQNRVGICHLTLMTPFSHSGFLPTIPVISTVSPPADSLTLKMTTAMKYPDQLVFTDKYCDFKLKPKDL